MDVYVLDKSFTPVAVIDSFNSLIWTKRYYKNGDFELYLPATNSVLNTMKKDYFLSRDDDDSVMIIESILATTDAENGDYITVTGRSLESILARRIILGQTIIEADDAVQGLKALVDSQTAGYRGFPNFSVDDSLQIPADYKAQFTGQNLLDTVSSICEQYQIGMKMTVSNANIVLSFYAGNDTDVTFSPEFDNIINSQYLSDSTGLANWAVVAGQGEGKNRIILNVPLDNGLSGFELREIWVDARDISTIDGTQGGVPQQDYIEMLYQRGMEKLAEHEVAEAFEAEVNPISTYSYKTDYDLGDKVIVQNEYGITSNPRVVEITESWDDTGYKVVPTFDTLEVH